MTTTADFIAYLRQLSSYWAAQPGLSEKERCDGLAHSFLVALDGLSAALPAITLSIDGETLHGDFYLHEMYFNPPV